MDKRTENALIIFLRYPEPGRVKTRLARDIGDGAAARVYREMAESVIESTGSEEDYKSLVFYTPRERDKGVRLWLNGYGHLSFFPQGGGDLGERMQDAFKRVFTLGYSKAIIIGTDCLEIARGGINSAFEVLSHRDAVIGPADDGGYYLLGLKEPYPFLFEGMEWGTPRVLARTLSRARKYNLSIAKLRVLPDIDTYDDIIKHRPGLLSRGA